MSYGRQLESLLRLWRLSSTDCTCVLILRERSGPYSVSDFGGLIKWQKHFKVKQDTATVLLLFCLMCFAWFFHSVIVISCVLHDSSTVLLLFYLMCFAWFFHSVIVILSHVFCMILPQCYCYSVSCVLHDSSTVLLLFCHVFCMILPQCYCYSVSCVLHDSSTVLLLSHVFCMILPGPLGWTSSHSSMRTTAASPWHRSNASVTCWMPRT